MLQNSTNIYKHLATLARQYTIHLSIVAVLVTHLVSYSRAETDEAKSNIDTLHMCKVRRQNTGMEMAVVRFTGGNRNQTELSKM